MVRASSFLPSFLPLIIPCSLSRSLIISSTPMSMFLFESCVISLSNLRFKTRIINVQTTLEENTGQHLPYHDQCSIGGISCPFINDQATPIKEWPGQYIDIGIVAIGQYRALYIQLREQGNQSFSISSTESLETSAISSKVYPFAFSLLAMARASSFLPLIIPCSLSRSLIISSTPMSMFLFENCVISLSNLRFNSSLPTNKKCLIK